VALDVVDTGKEVQPAGAVIHVQVGIGVVEISPAQGLGVRSGEVETETVALAPDGLDAHHGTHGGV
ncbi:MAG: hypothetical protein J6X20_06860, partial [Bacteroidales bacterium]|nr:hypothetical protein [Bacteroidales bacterium]